MNIIKNFRSKQGKLDWLSKRLFTNKYFASVSSSGSDESRLVSPEDDKQVFLHSYFSLRYEIDFYKAKAIEIRDFKLWIFL